MEEAVSGWLRGAGAPARSKAGFIPHAALPQQPSANPPQAKSCF